METESNTTITNPPRLITSILSGFNTVANHIQLILLPILLDLFLWFGPRFRVKSIMDTLFQDMFQTIVEFGTQEMSDMLRANLELMQYSIDHYNLFTALRTLPVGIFSLMADRGSLNSPLSKPIMLEAPNVLSAVGIWLLLMVIGFFLGTLYFSEIARFCRDAINKFSFKEIGFQFSNTMILVICFFILLVIISFPISIMVSILGIINPTLAQVGLFIILFFVLWLLFPLLFSPHGIFYSKLGALKSVITSARVIRFLLPSTGLFLLTALLLSEVLNLLWLSPPDTSWMTLVGILGHAYISTSLLASSFIFYRDGVQWMLHVSKKMTSQQADQN